MIDMTDLINFSPIRSGGGLQNCLSFVAEFAKKISNPSHYLFVSRNCGALSAQIRQSNFKSYTIRGSAGLRLWDEYRLTRRIKKGSLCFTHFGPQLLGGSHKLLNVVGCAYSNLFYDTDFWGYLPIRERGKKNLIDSFRRAQLVKADYWIFETEALRRRAILIGFPADRVGVVKMAPSSLVSPDYVSEEYSSSLIWKKRNVFRMLFLCGAHPNKRLHLLPKIALELRRLGAVDISFVFTFDNQSVYGRNINKMFIDQGVAEFYENLGPIMQEDVSTVISTCDAMATFSLLESFSNNFVEAWRMRKPLFVTDADWARLSCSDGAVYCDPCNASQTARQLMGVMNDAQRRNELISAGTKVLGTYPSAAEKFALYMEELDRARELGPARKPLNVNWL